MYFGAHFRANVMWMKSFTRIPAALSDNWKNCLSVRQRPTPYQYMVRNCMPVSLVLFVLLLYVPSQQLWSWRDGHLTLSHFFLVSRVHTLDWPSISSDLSAIEHLLDILGLRVLLDFSLTVKAAPHECVIKISQP